MRKKSDISMILSASSNKRTNWFRNSFDELQDMTKETQFTGAVSISGLRHTKANFVHMRPKKGADQTAH